MCLIDLEGDTNFTLQNQSAVKGQKLGLCLQSLIFLSSRRVSPFLAWGYFHAHSRFARSTISEEKWGNTRSLNISYLISALVLPMPANSHAIAIVGSDRMSCIFLYIPFNAGIFYLSKEKSRFDSSVFKVKDNSAEHIFSLKDNCSMFEIEHVRLQYLHHLQIVGSDTFGS